MSEVILYHNPRCSKSRPTVGLPGSHAIEPRIIEHLKTPPSTQGLDGILELLGLEPRQLMRRKDQPYAELGLDDAGLDRSRLLTAMLGNPILIERPIVVAKGRAVLGRPPESVLEIL